MWCQVSHRPSSMSSLTILFVRNTEVLLPNFLWLLYIYIHIRVYWVLCETVKAQISWEDNDAQLTAPGNSRPMPPTSLHTLGENFYHLGLLTKQKLEVQASKIKQKWEFQVSSLEIFPYLPLIPWIPMVKNRSGLLVLPEVACKRHLRKHQEMQPQPAGLVWGKSTGNPGLYH